MTMDVHPKVGSLRESSIRDSPLPLSVEQAYHDKCVNLKKRLNEVEEANDAARMRVARLERAIAKDRVVRAILLDRLHKKQERLPDDVSENSTPEHSPRDSRIRSLQVAVERGLGGPPAESIPQPIIPAPAFTMQSIPSPHYSVGNPSGALPIPGATLPYDPPPSGSGILSATQFPPHQFPLIQTLPNGTSVMLVAPGRPKSAPWTINELDPRHHYNPAFDMMGLAEQEHELFDKTYLPFDPYGQAIAITWNPQTSKYKQIAPGEAGWQDPVHNAIRQDSVEHRKRIVPVTRNVSSASGYPRSSRGPAEDLGDVDE